MILNSLRGTHGLPLTTILLCNELFGGYEEKSGYPQITVFIYNLMDLKLFSFAGVYYVLIIYIF